MAGAGVEDVFAVGVVAVAPVANKINSNGRRSIALAVVGVVHM